MKIPRTITGLVAAGSVLAALPLVIALLLADLALGRVSDQTRALLDEGLTVSELGTRLRGNLIDLERAARQYLVLHDAGLLELTERRWQDAAATLQQLHGGIAQLAETPAAQAIESRFDAARERWNQAGVGEAAHGEAIDDIHALLGEAEALAAAGRMDTDEKVQLLRADVTRAQHQMLVWSLTLIPLVMLLAWGFSLAVTRPVKQMYLAIAALGRGRYAPGAPVELPREMRRLGQQIDWLRGRLALLEENKDRFLRQVSHELKTPLASLREGTELLREGALGQLTQRQGEVAAILSESTVELEALIDNLLAYSEWRAERQDAHKIWFDARQLIEEVLAVHRLRLEKRGLAMELKVREGRLFGLRVQMRVAIDNLVTNSIKHSPPGGSVEITVSASELDFELSVRDFGRGVADAEKEAIFEPFVRGSENEERGIRGTGIGLSIVRETLLAHGGSVSVEDAHPGARFVLRWPRADA